jgi:hypothetical protein
VLNGIALYRNTRIHLKCLRNEKNSVFFGSANISKSGIGEDNNCNFELNGFLEEISFLDNLYLDKIIANSEYVTKELYEVLKETLENLENFSTLDEECRRLQTPSTKSGGDFFLISELPMYKDIGNIYDSAIQTEKLNVFDIKCITHDLAIYNLDLNCTKDVFYENLNASFNNHPFIVGLKNEVKNNRRQSLAYGAVVGWIRNNTTTVPTPISWDLKEREIVNVLYEWICFFDLDFIVERPSYSEVLFYKRRITLNNINYAPQ